MGNEQIIRGQKYPKGNQVIILFSFTAEIVAAVKTIPGRCYDPKTREWRIPFHADFQEYLPRKFANITCLELIAVRKGPVMIAVTLMLLDTLYIRQYSRNPIRSYIAHFVVFMNFFPSGYAMKYLSV